MKTRKLFESKRCPNGGASNFEPPGKAYTCRVCNRDLTLRMPLNPYGHNVSMVPHHNREAK